jgi:ABC-type Zn uptake system ZnuABC Zn-binding protein ZnuA
LRHLLLHSDVHGGKLSVFQDLLSIVQNDNVVQVLVRAGADPTVMKFRVEDVLSVASGRLAI